MIKLTDSEISKYFHRSYTAVDGLWFIKVEEKYGFDTALDIDNEVWKVMPKIQARFLKSKIKKKEGFDALFECFTTKLKFDGFKFKAEKENNNIIKITISSCPWHNTMIKSKSWTYRHASSSIGSEGFPPYGPQLLLITSAPLSAAHLIASARTSLQPDPPSLKPFTAIILVRQFTPTTPRLLFPTAAMVPEQCVP